jgi:hypothetical protein
MCAASSGSRARPVTKIYNRYRQEGVDALCDRSRRPVRHANQLPDKIERLIVQTKKGKPHWGARKIRELLVRRLAGDVRIPAKSTVHAVLDRYGLLSRARKRCAAINCRQRLFPTCYGTQLVAKTSPDDADLGVVAPFDDAWAIHLAAADRLYRHLRGPSVEHPQTRQRRQRLKHALRTVDGLHQGATYRRIAIAFFGERRVSEEPWKTNALKSQIARLAAYGRRMIDKGYRNSCEEKRNSVWEMFLTGHCRALQTGRKAVVQLPIHQLLLCGTELPLEECLLIAPEERAERPERSRCCRQPCPAT